VRLDTPVMDVPRQALHMPARFAIEDDHAGEKLHDYQQSRVGMIAAHLAAPFAADRKHRSIEMSNVPAMLIDERVIAAEIYDVAPEPIELRLTSIHQKEREVLRH